MIIIAAHGILFYYSCISDRFPFFWFCVNCLFWELVILLAGGIMAALFYLGNKLYKWAKNKWTHRPELKSM